MLVNRSLQQTTDQGYTSPNYLSRNNYLARSQGYIKQEQQGPRYSAKDFINGKQRAATYQGSEKMTVEEESPDQQKLSDEEKAEKGFHENENLNYYYPRENESYQSKTYFVTSIIARFFRCLCCRARFLSKNTLHKHVRSQECQLSKTFFQKCQLSEASKPLKPFAAFEAHANYIVEIIKSTAGKSIAASRHLLRLYYYLRAVIKLSPRAIAELVCWNTECSVTLIDRIFLQI